MAQTSIADNKMRDVEVDVVTHSINSIQHASDTLKRIGAIETLEESLWQSMPRTPNGEPKINSITAYSMGQQAYLKGTDYHTPLPKYFTHELDYKAGWLNMARTQCAMYKDLKTILEQSPAIEEALRNAGKLRLANHFKKLTTPPPSEEGRSAACV